MSNVHATSFLSNRMCMFSLNITLYTCITHFLFSVYSSSGQKGQTKTISMGINWKCRYALSSSVRMS